MRDIPLPTHIDEVEFDRLIDFARDGGIEPLTVARLAERLADSGERLTWPSAVMAADIASTGGPGSLSTLLSPFVLNALDCKVVKLGVPGRPAGAIDSLGTVPGYRVTLSSDQVRESVNRCGFAHFLAGERFAPLDAALFAYRCRVGAVALPLLVASSLLAKKLAVGVRIVGLDVRVGKHGSFGTTHEAARLNAQAFCAAARLLGIEAVAFVSRADHPMQPLIGRGEALMAVACAAGLYQPAASDWLDGHIRQCYFMADTVAAAQERHRGDCTPLLAGVQRQLTLRRALESHLLCQGSTVDALLSRVSDVSMAPHRILTATQAGVLALDLGIIRGTLVRVQADSARGTFNDPAGIELLAKPGQHVTIGQQLARIRCADSVRLGSLAAELQQAFSLLLGEDSPVIGEPESMEVLRG
jgi:pyrimidine-nucleoside phosphorylase